MDIVDTWIDVRYCKGRTYPGSAGLGLIAQRTKPAQEKCEQITTESSSFKDYTYVVLSTLQKHMLWVYILIASTK